MGKTRDFLTSLKNIVFEYQHKKNALIRTVGSNADQLQLCRHKVAALDQKYQSLVNKMIDEHLKYLDKPDPYGRKPILDAKVKKELFNHLKIKLSKSKSNLKHNTFMHTLEQEVEIMTHNPIIDQPRWAPLSIEFNPIFNFFKSILNSMNSEKKPSSSPKKTR